MAKESQNLSLGTIFVEGCYLFRDRSLFCKLFGKRRGSLAC